MQEIDGSYYLVSNVTFQQADDALASGRNVVLEMRAEQDGASVSMVFTVTQTYIQTIEGSTPTVRAWVGSDIRASDTDPEAFIKIPYNVG